MLSPYQPRETIIRLPSPHKVQEIFYHWDEWYPNTQCLVAPCGTKVGKTFGSALWLAKESLSYPDLYNAWIGPTYLKAMIGYRYMKSLLNFGDNQCVDGRLEIRLGNGSFIKFLHGRDAETTVEGENISRFVIDEAGKTSRQVWYSLFTTITQTMGYGIVTGTPRGFTWYYDIFRQAKNGDPFFCHAQIKTEESPYVAKQAIEQAKRLLPKPLFDQYYLGSFISSSSCFGDLSRVWDDSVQVPLGKVKFWIHPDQRTRSGDIVTGIDFARQKDYTVFYSINMQGQLVGYCRFRQVPYTIQIDRLKKYIETYFKGDNIIRYDATGVGVAIGDLISEAEIDALITGVTFTQKSKSEMVTRTTMAIEQDWHKAPRIEQIEHEFASYELNVTKAGNYTFSCPEGDHDDVVSAAILAISYAYQSAQVEEAERLLEQALNGKIPTKDDDSDLVEYAEAATGKGDDDFFDEQEDDDFDFDETTA